MQSFGMLDQILWLDRNMSAELIVFIVVGGLIILVGILMLLHQFVKLSEDMCRKRRGNRGT